jgi:hypothetical protein
MGGIFINYRTVDSALGAVMLDEKLIARFGPDAVFRDNRSIELAAEFEPYLGKRLRASSLLIVIIGPHWLTEAKGGRRLIDDPDDFVRREIAEALTLDIDVLPVLIGDTQLPAAAVLPAEVRGLAGRQFHTIRARDPEPDIDRLVEKLAARPDLVSLPEKPWRAAETAGGIHINHVGRDVIAGDQTNYYGGGA